ncbi:MAG: hypothetical protein ACF8MJ_01020 [Phycisphaerales bacterium JB050]
MAKKKTTKKTRKANSFKRPVSHDHEILNGDGKKIGELRVTPSALLWKESGQQSWKGVTLQVFREWIKEEGTTRNR